MIDGYYHKAQKKKFFKLVSI
ncbi:Uncharacterized protein CTYZ_00000082 [Cryptosporidium tyzzeri]|nr:Uncharacterized protein CTYZ_00000082 [Cryptosporidium tyzzeri]